MKSYDVVIVGAATAGSYFARRMAERGHSVLVLDPKTADTIGDKYDIFHVARGDFDTFGLPLPQEGEDLAFRFTGGTNYSSYGRYPKPGGGAVVGMHMHLYTLRMNRWAQDAGAQIAYGAAFTGFLLEDGKISGVRYTQGGEEKEAGAKLVADCSGIPSAARRALPAACGVETFEITPEEMFYVTLRYVLYHDPKDAVHATRSWPFYKTWEAPQADPQGAILGVGANFSFDYGEKIYAEFEKAIPLPERTLQRIERGVTPYRRPPYSFVADGFVAMGDAACLTKPSCGEGVTSALVQSDIAVEVCDGLLKAGRPLTRQALWPINKRYVEAQGAAFASQLATLSGAVATNAKENDFFFGRDIIFSKKSFQAMGEGKELAFTRGETASMAFRMLGGVLTGKLRVRTIRALLKAMGDGAKVKALYAEYPASPEGYESWALRADALWQSCGTMADAVKNA